MQALEPIARRYFSLFDIGLMILHYKTSENELPRVMVKDCNDILLDMLGIRREEIVSRPLSGLLEERSYEQSLPYVYMCMKLKKKGSGALSLKDGQGRTHGMQVDFFPLTLAESALPDAPINWCWVMRPTRRS